MPRLFFAAPIPEPIREKLLHSLSKKIFHEIPASLIRLVPKENLHLTIHFLGAVNPEKVDDALETGKEICSGFPAFQLQFQTLETVFRKSHPELVWARFESNAAYHQLCLNFRKAFSSPAEKETIPHITLARIRQLREQTWRLPDIGAFKLHINRCELWKSVTAPSGAEYSMISGWELAVKP